MRKLFLFIVCFILFGVGIKAQRFPQAVLPGDYPDPSILRDGKNYYMTHSPFYYAPGFLIWHSTDLIHWEPVCRALPEYEGSAMAPDLLKYQGRYYIYYPTSTGENFVIYADNIRGPWSKPVKLDVKGIDPGHVVGEDGKRYLFTNNGWITPLSDDGLKVTGKSRKVYDGWEYPANWVTEGKDMYLESPKLLYKDGYYYMMSAEGGTAGPATSHMCVVARSKSVFGLWENSPYNPIVHTYSASENWWSKGHGTLIDDVNGNWWVVYHAYANGYHTLGRSTLIEPIEWTSDGWCRTTQDAVWLSENRQPEWKMELSDDFSKPELGLQWTFWKEYEPKVLTFTEGEMQVKAKGRTPADGRLLLVTAMDKCYETEVEVRLGNGNIGGLLLYYNEEAYAGVSSNGKNFTVYRGEEKPLTVANKIGKNFRVKLLNKGNRLKMSVSADGKSWEVLAQNVDVARLNHNVYKGFYALRPALFAAGKGKTGFRNFRYRNAIP